MALQPVTEYAQAVVLQKNSVNRTYSLHDRVTNDHAASGRIYASCCSENLIMLIKLTVSMMRWPCSQWQNMRKLLFCKGILLKKIPRLHDALALQPVAEYAQAVVL